jgi:hypothetical protein
VVKSDGARLATMPAFEFSETAANATKQKAPTPPNLYGLDRLSGSACGAASAHSAALR